MVRFPMMSLLLLGVSGVSCSTPLDEFVCSASEDCASNGDRGICEANGFCSFSDPACPSGQRYGSASGHDSNQCVGLAADAGGGDARVPTTDGGFEGACDALGFAILNVPNCHELPFEGDITLTEAGTYQLDTDTRTLSYPNGSAFVSDAVVLGQDEGPELLVMTAVNVTIAGGSEVLVRGSRPLVVLASGTMQIDGSILVTGDGSVSGAGGNLPGDCGEGRGSDGEVQVPGGAPGGSGGGGGGFGSSGGSGAPVVDSGGEPSPGGGVSGAATLVPLRGGCSGGKGGGNGSLEAEGGAGGGAGGAIQLVANRLNLAGIVSASGGGGGGVSSERSGGGGGGSGGAVLLQANRVSLFPEGILTANGGGGGEGADQTNGNTTERGSDGSRNSDLPAAGGSGSSGGGRGGSGATPAEQARDGREASPQSLVGGGGGGGGGGVGVIRIISHDDPDAPAPSQ